MFCFQCQQTAAGCACVNTGVCGKVPSTSNLQDKLVKELMVLAILCKKNNRHSRSVDRLIVDGLFTTLTNVNFDDNAIEEFIRRIKRVKSGVSSEHIDIIDLWEGDTDIVSLRSTLLFGLKGMAAYAHHAMNLGYEDNQVLKWFYKGLEEINKEHTVTEWIDLIMEFGRVNFKCMELLDTANTETFGIPSPKRVNTDIKKGPFIVVSGHDLGDLSRLLEQTEGTGVNVYTHCEMLPAHGYPELNKYPHLAGNFGTAWSSTRRLLRRSLSVSQGRRFGERQNHGVVLIEHCRKANKRLSRLASRFSTDKTTAPSVVKAEFSIIDKSKEIKKRVTKL